MTSRSSTAHPMMEARAPPTWFCLAFVDDRAHSVSGRGRNFVEYSSGRDARCMDLLRRFRRRACPRDPRSRRTIPPFRRLSHRRCRGGCHRSHRRAGRAVRLGRCDRAPKRAQSSATKCLHPLGYGRLLLHRRDVRIQQRLTVELLVVAVLGGVALAIVLALGIWQIVSRAVDNGLDWLIHTFRQRTGR